jgi:hypothetical protein
MEIPKYRMYFLFRFHYVVFFHFILLVRSIVFHRFEYGALLLDIEIRVFCTLTLESATGVKCAT